MHKQSKICVATFLFGKFEAIKIRIGCVMDVLQPARKTVLPNGITVISLQNPQTTMLRMNIVLNVGALDDDAQPGISHFLEHMMFSGTATRSQQEIRNVVLQMGGSAEAATSFDRTAYIYSAYADADAKNLETLLDIASDVLFNSVFPAHRLEHERSVILNENSEIHDDDVLEKYYTAALLKGTPYQNGIGGNADVIENLQRDDFIRFRQKKYGAHLATVYISGRYEHDLMIGAVANALDGWKPTDYKPQRDPAAFNTFDMRITDKSRVSNQLLLGFWQPQMDSLTFAARETVAMNLMDYAFRKEREETALSYGIGKKTRVIAPGLGLVNTIITTSRPQTSAAHCENVVNFLSRFSEKLDKEMQPHITRQLLEYYQTEPLAAGYKIHERMIGSYADGGRLYDHEAFVAHVANMPFHEVQAHAADKYQKPWTMRVIGPEPMLPPSLETISTAFGQPAQQKEKHLYNAGRLTPLFK